MNYATIEADGFFRDEATVVEVFGERTKAVASTSHDRRWQTIQGADLEIGQKIHRSSLGTIYPRVSSASDIASR